MESREKELSTALEVQQSIEHFKEQYLHSLGRNLSKGAPLPSAFLSSTTSSVCLRRESLSHVGTRRDSLSSSSSQEENLLSSSALQDQSLPGSGTWHGILSSSPTRRSNSRTRDSYGSLQTSVSTGTPSDTSDDGPDRTKFKDDYISSLGLLHKYRRQKSLPCLKDRVAEFETLMTKSAHVEVLVSNSKNSEQQNISQNPCAPVERIKYNLHPTLTHTFPRCSPTVGTAQSYGINHACHAGKSDRKQNILSDDSHSSEGSISGESYSGDGQQHSQYSNDHFQLRPIVKTTAYIPLHHCSKALSSSASGTDSDCVTDVSDKHNTAQPFCPRKDIFEDQPGETSPVWDTLVNKHTNFVFEHPAIHKAYTEKEKAFILESMRKSGGRQQRTRSLGSCFSLQTEPSVDDLSSKIPKQSPVPCKLTQSVTNIINIFEAAHHSEPQVPIMRADVRGKVKMSGTCSKQTHIKTELSGQEQGHSVQFICDNSTDSNSVDQVNTQSVDSCLTSPTELSQEKDSTGEESCHETLGLTTERGVHQNKCDHVSTIDRMFEMPHTIEDDSGRRVGRKDILVQSHREFDKPNNIEHYLCRTNIYEHSLADSKRYNYTATRILPLGDIASEDPTHRDNNSIFREKSDVDVAHISIGIDSSLLKYPHSHDGGHYNEGIDSSLMKYPYFQPDSTLANMEPQDVCDVTLKIPQCVFSTVSRTDATDEKLSDLLINELTVNPQSVGEIPSNIVEDIATVTRVVTTVAWHENPSVSTYVSHENITENNIKHLADKLSLTNPGAEREQGNLTRAINRSLGNDEKKTTGETGPHQYHILPYSYLDELGNSGDVTGAIECLDKGNQACTTNNHHVSSEQTLNPNGILLDVHDDVCTRVCMYDVGCVGASHYSDSILCLNTVDGSSVGLHDLSYDAGTSRPGDTVSNDAVSTDQRTVNVAGLTELLQAGGISKSVQDSCHKCEKKDDEGMLPFRRYDNTENCDWSNQSLKPLVSYSVSEKSNTNTGGIGFAEKTSVMNNEDGLHNRDMGCLPRSEQRDDTKDYNKTSSTESSTTRALLNVDRSYSHESDCCSTINDSGSLKQANMSVNIRNHNDFVSPLVECEEQTMTVSGTTKVDNFIASLVDGALLECSLHCSKYLREDISVISFDKHCEETPGLLPRDQHEVSHEKVPAQPVYAAQAEVDDCVNTMSGTGDDSRDFAARDKLSEPVYLEHLNLDHMNGCNLPCHVNLVADGTSGMEERNYLSSPAELQNSLSGNNINLFCGGSELDNIDHQASDLISEKAENQSVPKSSAFSVSGSFSDISDSVDSFYSGSSEVTESFHSAEDMEMVSSGDQTYSILEDVCARVPMEDNDSKGNEHISNKRDLFSGQSQYYRNNADIVDGNIISVSRSDCPSDVSGSSNILWKELSDLTVPTDDNEESHNYTQDSAFTINIPANPQTEIKTESALDTDPALRLSMDLIERPDHADDDKSHCVNIIVMSEDTVSGHMEDIYAPGEVVNVCVSPLEGSSRLHAHELHDQNTSKSLSLDRISEADVGTELQHCYRGTDDPLSCKCQQTDNSKAHERVADECSQEHTFMELSGDTRTIEPGNNSNSQRIDINTLINIPQYLHPDSDEAHSETLVETFCNRVDNIETRLGKFNVTPILMTEEGTGYQNYSPLTLSMNIKQNQEPAANRVDDVFINEKLSAESRNKDSSKATSDHDEINKLTSCPVFPDSGFDNNTDSDDDQSMDIDSLEEDADGNRKGYVILDPGLIIVQHFLQQTSAIKLFI